jgi:hypothetical protein
MSAAGPRNGSGRAAVLTNGSIPTNNNATTAGGGPRPPVVTMLDPTQPSLSVCVLSAYDLPVRDPPLYVSISVGNHDDSSSTIPLVKIGPPLQRHKDRNSFKFPSEAGCLTASSLPELYQNTAVVKVVYPNASQTLSGTYALNQLKLHETVWIILQLEGSTSDDPPSSDGNSNNMTIPPTLRLQWTLHGPYRAEIGFVVNMFQQWFGFVDALENKVGQLVKGLPDARFLWIPAVPILAVGVVTAPALAGVAIVTLPVAVPIITLLVVVLGVLVGLVSFVYASTKPARTSIAGLFAPAVQTIMATKAGQTALYQTGPRPTPVSMCRAILPVDGFISKLLLSLLIDAIGSASYLVPVVGEITDLGWAPVQMILLMALYETANGANDGSNGGGGGVADLEWLKYVSFVEEILPFTDIVPTATLGWFIQCGLPHWFGKDVAATLTSALSTMVVPTVSGQTPTQRSAAGQTTYAAAAASTTSRTGPVRQVVVTSG